MSNLRDLIAVIAAFLMMVASIGTFAGIDTHVIAGCALLAASLFASVYVAGGN